MTYFGQPYERDHCGACDVCLGEIVAGDAGTGGATRLLEAVDTLRGRFGATHVVDVLVGAATARMAQLGHDRLDVYGVLRGEKKGQVRAWIDQLLAHGLLARTDDEYPTVTLTAEGRAVLRGDAPAPALSSVRVVSPVAPQPAAGRDSAATFPSPSSSCAAARWCPGRWAPRRPATSVPSCSSSVTAATP